MKSFKLASYVLPLVLFILTLLAVPVKQLHGLAFMPGDLGDARLLNYFLENIYQFIFDGSASLWHLSFFYPFPYVLGFSDNLFGSAPVYVLARLLIGQSDTAYQVWFLVGYVTNFTATYYALRRIGGSQFAASIGALIFTFALPTTAHAGHAQLHYRFGIPLATVFFFDFLSRKDFRLFVIAGAWMVWQFYCGIYIGFFTLLLLAVATIVHFIYCRYSLKKAYFRSLQEFFSQWILLNNNQKIGILISIFALVAALALLFYPYLQVSQLYGAKRSWAEISLMLPRPQSYFLSDASYFWSSPESKFFSDIPMRHEHQMFIGLVPMSLAVAGFIIGSHNKNGHLYILMSGVIGGMLVLTMYIGGFSLWYLLHKLPFASAIRAITRIDQVLLLPIAYLAVVALDFICSQWKWGTKFILIIILPLMIFEFAATSMNVSNKVIWRDRLSVIETNIANPLTKDSILFFAQNKGPFYADELDAMLVSLKLGAKTLNGYSGVFPPGYAIEYSTDCSEVPKRVLSFLSFEGKSSDKDAYHSLMKRIVPIGFEGCDSSWVENPPNITKIDRKYTPTEVHNIDYRFVSSKQFNGQSVITLRILNFGEAPISSQSGVGSPLLLSWRFLDASGKPTSGWDSRKELPFDIPSRGDLLVRIPIDPKTESKGGMLEISLVQEGVFWAHDVGVKPLGIPWK